MKRILIQCCFLLAGTVLGQTNLLINVDAGFSSTNIKAGFAATGQATNDVWNGVLTAAQTFVVRSNLLSAGGIETPVSLILSNVPWIWGNGSRDPMYAGFLYNNEGTGTARFEGLPEGVYDLYVYSYDGTFQVQVGATNYGARVSRDDPVSNPPPWVEGKQFTLFRSVGVQAGQALVVNLGSPGNLSGMQLLAHSAPVVLSPPASQLAIWGQSNVTFRVRAMGWEPLQYQWYKDGVVREGATGSTLMLDNLEMKDAGSYTVVVSNAWGSVTSSALLTINPAGVTVAMHAGVTIKGIAGHTYGIQHSEDLSTSNSWVGATNLTITSSSQEWIDPEAATRKKRYYRVVPGPIAIP